MVVLRKLQTLDMESHGSTKPLVVHETSYWIHTLAPGSNEALRQFSSEKMWLLQILNSARKLLFNQ